MTKSHLVHGAHVLTETAACNYKAAVTTHNSLCKYFARGFAHKILTWKKLSPTKYQKLVCL
jgi:hypothetical protein